MKFLSIILLIAVAANAQTKLTVTNARSTPGEPRVWVALPDGTMAEAKLEGNITLDLAGARPVLRVTAWTAPAPAIIPSQKQMTVVSVPTQNIFQATFPIEECFWNGILMAEGQDYSLSTDKQTLTFNAAMPSTGDIVIIKSAVAPAKSGNVR